MSEEFCYVTWHQLRESPLQTRRHYDEAKLRELALSIKAVGILTPLLVRPNGQAANGAPFYEIGAGHRRFRAAGMVHLHTNIPVRVREMDDAAFMELITLENLQREDIHPLDEALGFRALMRTSGYDVPAVAARVGKSDSYVYQRLKLTNLIEPGQQAFLAGTINASHALLIARLQPQDQEKALHACVDNEEWGPNGRERVVLSAQELSWWIEDHVHLDLQGVLFNKKDATLVPTAGACVTCEKRTGFLPELWPDIKKKDQCTDRECFEAKITAHIVQQKKKLQAKQGVAPLLLSERFLYDNGKSKAKEPDAGPVTRDRWKEVDPAFPCDHQERGIVVEGRDPLGRVLTICVEPTCRVHHPFADAEARQDTREKRDAQREQQKLAISRRIFTQVLERAGDVGPHIPGLTTVVLPLPRAVLNLILGNLWDRTWADTRKRVAKHYQWDLTPDLSEYGAQWIAQSQEEDLAKFLVVWVTINTQQLNRWDKDVKLLHELAAAYGLDVERITKEVKDTQRQGKGQRRQKKPPVIVAAADTFGVPSPSNEVVLQETPQ